MSERRSIETTRRLDLEQVGCRVGPLADPYMTGWLTQFHRDGDHPHVEFGIVVDVTPGVHNYRVSAGVRGFLYCSTTAPDAAFGPSGVRPTHSIPPLTPVYFVRDSNSPDIGYIVAAQPHWSVHSGYMPADAIWPFTRTGLGVEPAHRFPVSAQAQTAQDMAVPMESVEGADMSAGRPFDGTTVGEWGRMAETGVAVHLDPFSFYVRVDESTGVFGFYEDQLLRVAGHNFQFVSSVCETEHLDDEGELYGHTRRCVYPFETYGLHRYNQVTPGWSTAAVANHGTAGGQGQRLTDPTEAAAGSGYAVREPEAVGQLSAARIMSWSGYLGQGGFECVVAPVQLDWAYPSVPDGAATAQVDFVEGTTYPSGRMSVNGVSSPTTQPLAVPVNSYGGPDRPGVFEEHRGLHGTYGVRALNRIVLAKRPSIPVARPLRVPADPGGDGPGSGYAASGRDGNDVAHLVRSGPSTGTDSGLRCALLPDVIVHMFNWENVHPFAYHEDDWAIPQEGAAGSDIVNQTPPVYADLGTVDALPAPVPKVLDIDARFGPTSVYENESVFGMLDDGSIVIRDGWGSAIVMRGGNIELRAAGDVRLMTGRDVHVWAGYDVILKAHNSIDLTASHGDLRTAAARNSHHVSGVSGWGGHHFESQAQCPAHNYTDPGQGTVSSGFTIRCPSSTVDVVAADVRVALDDAAPASARITFDAGTSRAVYTRAKQIVDRVTANGAVVQLFNDGAGALVSANEFAHNYAAVGSALNVKGKTCVTDCLMVDGWVVSNYHFASVTSSARDGTVSQYNGDFDATVGDIDDRIAYLIGPFGSGFDAQTLPAPNVTDAEFSFRTDTEYRSAAFTVWRSYWEQIAAADSQTLVPWVELELTGIVSGDTSRPFPGDRWTQSGGYKYADTLLVDTDGWVGIDRSANRTTYESGSFGTAQSGTLSDLYKITVEDAGD